ncbi:MAG TPA: hypothetical protein VFB82_02625, partial [Blastocatellia bacterium]|nr:hypothetical protein [Blastocatellia bacterium]
MKTVTFLLVSILFVATAAPAASTNPQKSNADRASVQEADQRGLSGVELELSKASVGEVTINVGDVDAAVSFLARDRRSATATRIFSNGVEVEGNKADAGLIERSSAVVDPLRRTISITGSLYGQPVHEDIWIVDTPDVS